MFEFKSYASGSKGNMYTLTDGKTKIMIEAGINIKEIRKSLNFKMSQVDGLLLSHSHGDHSKAIKNVLNNGIDCYMSEDTAKELNINHHRFKKIEARKQFQIGTFTILPFEAEHDVTTYGFLIVNEKGQRFLFITDSYYCRYKFKNISHIAIECNYSIDILNRNIDKGLVHPALKYRLMKSHFSLENVKEFLKANDLSKVQEIHLIHLSDNNSDEQRFKREIQELTGKPVYVS